MADTKFTPGPWSFEVIRHIWKLGMNAAIAEGYVPTDQAVNDTINGVSDANAHLIAAAPELYEAVEELTAAMKKYGMDVDGDAPAAHREMMHKAESALAKARGEA
ncbi:hypothetical protein [Brucella pseudogrignonensis]|uniref:Uncharacterized protein n=1 Tax=Brucella pseudogrignonensis TaxID=419475 RepID=A0ABU1M4Q1_9HYPH|nr:hypothetical protein [Brucella pseudogrignonensis]MDR6431027.1 hypothetical protein [Brucella pseudogrignonensis]